MTTPMEKYREDLTHSGFSYDPAQEMAVEKLDDLYHRLLQPRPASSVPGKRALSVFARKLKVQKKAPEPIRGLYFWGGVGRGKTYLMDTFFDCLPFERKMRAHFHRFMQRVHQELTALKGQKDPLEKVADILAGEARIICFDEFFVTDIGDAMILGTLLEALFRREVCLVCTSNIVPDGLYKDGLQRARFLPAIALLNAHTEVVNVDGGTDYRLRSLRQARLYYTPADASAEEGMARHFSQLLGENHHCERHMVVNSRDFLARERGEDIVWFDFPELCDKPRSQNDYIELAREFHTVLISRVPVFQTDTEDQARRFINLIDEFYDRRVKLILSAEAQINALYEGVRLRFEFDRTESRLLEMQAEAYLAEPHRA